MFPCAISPYLADGQPKEESQPSCSGEVVQESRSPETATEGL